MSCAAGVTRLDLHLDDVDAGAQFFQQVLALPVVRDGEAAEVRLSPDLVARLHAAPDADPPAIGTGSGIILQIQVPHLGRALTELRRRGATVLLEPVLTDWDTESAFIAGPDAMVIEVYRPGQS